MQGARNLTKRPKDNDKAQRDFFLNRTEKQAAKVRITEKALDRLDVVEKPWESWDLRLEIASAPRSGAIVARLRDAVVHRGDFTLGPIDLEIGWAERVAILGPNGAGKTTLLGALLGRIPLDSGEQWLGPGVVVGEIDQAREQLSGRRVHPRRLQSGERTRAPAGGALAARQVRPRRPAMSNVRRPRCRQASAPARCSRC